MFINDRPIEESKDDKLGRSSFSLNLAKAILEWKGIDSLVIALFGKWGSGKSSVINLAKAGIKQSKEENKPTIIEFNPWFFSGEEKLNEHFFNEVAKELEIQNGSEKDIDLANKIRSYSKLFGLVPDKGMLKEILEKIVIAAGLFGVSLGPVLQWLHVDIGIAKIILFIIGFLLLILSLTSSFIDKVADYFEKRGTAKEKTVLSFKKEIKIALSKRKNKILIIIDDIDRLTPEEIRQVFKLIKINTDFPNVIYLLSFDRYVIQKALAEQPGISGQDYIEKIVQVNFDIPLAKQSKIAQILFGELDRILAGLPKSSEALFDQTYWGNVYHSGLNDFFRNVRDVKRFASGLEFSFALMHKEQSMEVNPIDFIAIEAIRLFTPDFYDFMRTRNDLFTSTERDRGNSQTNPRAKEIKDEINKLPEAYRENMEKLLSRLFPQIEGVFRYGYSSHGSEWIATWNRYLRVCSPQFFDAYFTLVPGGDEAELSQFEVDSILAAVSNQAEFEKIIRELLAKGKIRKVLDRIQNYTKDTAKLPDEAISNVVETLFNISDDLPSDRNGMFDLGSDLEGARIIYQLLSRNEDKTLSFTILKEAAEKSKGLYGPVYNISLEAHKLEKEKSDSMLVPPEKLDELKKIGLAKILERKESGTLNKNDNFVSILYRWKEWSETEDWKEYIKGITTSDEGLISFIKPFISESISHTFGDYVGKKTKRFSYTSLNNFLPSEEVKTRLEAIKTSNNDIYQKNKDVIDMFLDNFGKRNGPLDD